VCVPLPWRILTNAQAVRAIVDMRPHVETIYT
jgi:hypothetical protein